MFDELYRNVRIRVTELAATLTDEQLATRVPGTPEWTGRQLVAHLAGVAADMATGNLDGAPKQPWTAAQVTAREGRSLDELLAEWRQHGPTVEAGLADRTFGAVPIFDVFTHECDLREAFGLGRPPRADVETVARIAAKNIVRKFEGPVTLVVRAGGQEWTGGDGERRAVLTAEPYELLRALFSRRSRRQLRTWQWDGDGDPDEVIERLPVFGARDDDQPVPA